MLQELVLFRHYLDITVRYSDIDMLGHLNNARYLNYLEDARISYANEVLGFAGKWERPDTLLVKTEISYRQQISILDTIRVYIRCQHVGGRSIEYAYIFIKNHQVQPLVAATATTLMLMFDFNAQKPISVPQTYRQRILAFEPAFKNSDA